MATTTPINDNDDPTTIEELARSLREPLLAQEQHEPSVSIEDEELANLALTWNPVCEEPVNDEPDNEDASTTSSTNSVILYDGLPSRKQSMLIKSLYFLDALGSSAWGRFSAIYYNRHGLDTREIGTIEGLRTFTPTISSLGWGYLSDRYNSRKLVWVSTKSVGTLILLGLSIPSIASYYYRILVVSVLAQIFLSNGGAILDSYTLESLGTKHKLLYGRYRMYASMSWGLGSIVMGWITDHYGFDWNFIMFGTLSAIMIGLVAYCIPDSSNESEKEQSRQVQSIISTENGSSSTSNNYQSENELDTHDGSDDSEQQQQHNSSDHSITELIYIILQPRVLFFLVEVIIMGAAMATVERLLFLYMVNDLKSSTLLCGLSVGVNVLFELPIFWYASQLLSLLGSDGMFVISMICFVIRVFGYTLLTPSTKWWILGLESMHGVTFATFWIVTTDVSKVLIDESSSTNSNNNSSSTASTSPEQEEQQRTSSSWATTIPSLVQMLYTAVGATIGTVLGGFAMNAYGSREMYRFTATLVSCMLLVHLVGSILARTTTICQSSLLPGGSCSSNTRDDEDQQQRLDSSNDTEDRNT